MAVPAALALLQVFLDPSIFNAFGLAEYFAKWTRNMAIVVYARVSTIDEDLSGPDRCAQGLRRDHDLPREDQRRPCVRPLLAKLMAALKPGDVVPVTKLDRLGR